MQLFFKPGQEPRFLTLVDLAGKRFMAQCFALGLV